MQGEPKCKLRNLSIVECVLSEQSTSAKERRKRVAPVPPDIYFSSALCACVRACVHVCVCLCFSLYVCLPPYDCEAWGSNFEPSCFCTRRPRKTSGTWRVDARFALQHHANDALIACIAGDMFAIAVWRMRRKPKPVRPGVYLGRQLELAAAHRAIAARGGRVFLPVVCNRRWNTLRLSRASTHELCQQQFLVTSCGQGRSARGPETARERRRWGGGRGWRANEIAFCLSKTLLSPTCYFTQPRSMVTGAHNMRFHSEARDQ